MEADSREWRSKVTFAAFPWSEGAGKKERIMMNECLCFWASNTSVVRKSGGRERPCITQELMGTGGWRNAYFRAGQGSGQVGFSHSTAAVEFWEIQHSQTTQSG